MTGLVAEEKRAIKKVVKLADQLQKLTPSKEVIDLICGEVESGLHLSINYHDVVSGCLWKHLSTVTTQSSQCVILAQDASKAYLNISQKLQQM